MIQKVNYHCNPEHCYILLDVTSDFFLYVCRSLSICQCSYIYTHAQQIMVHLIWVREKPT